MKEPQVEVLGRSSVLTEGLKLPNKFDLLRTRLTKSVVILIIMSFLIYV